jgi:hypothetical protein
MVRVATLLVLCLAANPVWAQQLTLDIRDGLVTLDASNVPVRQVLAEWARVGGTKVVGAERLGGAPLTLRLEAVPEAKALDIVLRGAAGYMAATRSTPGSGRSTYDRILVLATSTPPAGSGGPTQATGPAGRAPNRFAAPPPPQEPADSTDVGFDAADAQPPQTNPFANAFGQPGMAQPFGQAPQNPFGQVQPNPFGQPPQNPFGQPAQNPFGQPVPNPAAPMPNPFGQPLSPAPGAPGSLFMPVQPPPGGPFGAGAAIPGVVQQPPADPQQANRPRPPGR